MRKSRFTEEQIAFALKQAESGASVEEARRAPRPQPAYRRDGEDQGVEDRGLQARHGAEGLAVIHPALSRGPCARVAHGSKAARGHPPQPQSPRGTPGSVRSPAGPSRPWRELLMPGALPGRSDAASRSR